MAYVNKSDIYKLFNESNGVIKLHVADVDVLPTADVVEVKHGKWLKNNTECSACKELNPTMYLNEWDLEYKAFILPYCPKCGAKMDGGRA